VRARSLVYGLLESLYDRVKSAWEERFERSYGFWRGLVDEVVEQVGMPSGCSTATVSSGSRPAATDLRGGRRAPGVAQRRRAGRALPDPAFQ
jgi:hypothetical protein